MKQFHAAGEGRSNALWGKGSKGESRNSGFRRAPGLVVLCALAALVGVFAGSAGVSGARAASGSSTPTYVPADFLATVQANPHQLFTVIVQGSSGASAADVAQHLANYIVQANHTLADAAQHADNAVQQAQNTVTTLTKAFVAAQSGHSSSSIVATAQAALTAAQAALVQAQAAAAAAHAAVSQASNQALTQQAMTQYSSISGVSATLSGEQIASLMGQPGLLSITPDARVRQSGWSSNQLWPNVSSAANVWGSDTSASFAAATPSIAIVDSGIQPRSDFGARIVASVGFNPNGSTSDLRGHGTMVAGIAAGAATGYAGADPVANLVNLDVLDGNGYGTTSDILAACQWILDHQAQYNIRVANFSLNSAISAPFYIDPLDRAVEQLWFHGITVVVAAGNYGTGNTPSGVLYSPADDPYVITVGAADLKGTSTLNDDTAAPWSAWGYTGDGFAKPDVVAPGRYMIGPVPGSSTLVAQNPGQITAPGYIELSGTSFAAPVVSGVVAEILAKHPTWTPDQVKGALMVTARPMPAATPMSVGVGEIKADNALNTGNAPNPNVALDGYMSASSSNGVTSYAFNSAAWSSAAWSSAAWSSAAWSSAAWSSAAWSSAAWSSAAWSSAAWSSAAWSSAAWSSSTPDGAAGDIGSGG